MMQVDTFVIVHTINLFGGHRANRILRAFQVFVHVPPHIPVFFEDNRQFVGPQMLHEAGTEILGLDDRRTRQSTNNPPKCHFFLSSSSKTTLVYDMKNINIQQKLDIWTVIHTPDFYWCGDNSSHRRNCRRPTICTTTTHKGGK